MNYHHLYLVPALYADAPGIYPLREAGRYGGLDLLITDEPIVTRYPQRKVIDPAEQLAVLYVAAYGRWHRDGGISPSALDVARFMAEYHAVADAYEPNQLADLLDALGEIGSDEQQIGAHLMAHSSAPASGPTPTRSN